MVVPENSIDIEQFRRMQQSGKTRPDYEEHLAWELTAAGLGHFQRQYRFHAERKWLADFAFLEERVLVEVEGVVAPGAKNPRTGKPIKSRHQTISGYREDCRKYNSAVIAGWRVLRVTQDMVKSGEALETVEKALGVRR